MPVPTQDAGAPGYRCPPIPAFPVWEGGCQAGIACGGWEALFPLPGRAAAGGTEGRERAMTLFPAPGGRLGLWTSDIGP
ncbi:MAG: hypothetical protein K6U11_13725 [bacterium]|nr:hypothetical protein [bacterium]